ncbi:MAG: hypothetical protein ACLUEQ_00165 [Cloacibacillus evryensis]
MIMGRARVGFGVAILENAYDETAMIEAIQPKGSSNGKKSW